MVTSENDSQEHRCLYTSNEAIYPQLVPVHLPIPQYLPSPAACRACKTISEQLFSHFQYLYARHACLPKIQEDPVRVSPSNRDRHVCCANIMNLVAQCSCMLAAVPPENHASVLQLFLLDKLPATHLVVDVHTALEAGHRLRICFRPHDHPRRAGSEAYSATSLLRKLGRGVPS
jgi:hypothetical protein